MLEDLRRRQVASGPRAAPTPRVDQAGAPLEVAVYRTNGYEDLAQRAITRVVDAAPFDTPGPALLQGHGSVSFLETFLFRDDDSFQLRSLVPTP